ncbi:DUF2316 family protein [Streptomyces sp. NBC_01465]|uniref:DUF2316 family protein n=1 Tax=Streptomyces sp. NBC_01465 TaxID=2903878 RepID=UPI002E302834|nr:DUF2316 family protein [Streptomyces sp. NBC_01465]
MSLNATERLRTSEELKTNLRLSGLTPGEAAADLHFTPRRLRDALDASSDPADVWQLRDYLEHAARDAGQHPTPYTVLTDRARLLARAWFSLRKAPRHDFTAPS